MLKLRPKDPEKFVIEGLDIPVKVLASSSFPAPPLDVSSTYIIEGAPGYGNDRKCNIDFNPFEIVGKNHTATFADLLVFRPV